MDSILTPSPSGDNRHFEIELSSHSIERYNQRVKPCLDFPGAEDDLMRNLSRFGEISFERPSWLRPPRARTDAWALLPGLGIALPLVKAGAIFVATTTLARGSISEGERARRNRIRKKKLRTRRGH